MAYATSIKMVTNQYTLETSGNLPVHSDVLRVYQKVTGVFCLQWLPSPLLPPSLWLSPFLLPIAATIAVDVSFIIAATFGVTEAAFIPPYNYLPLTMVRKTTINLFMCLCLNFNQKLD